MITASMLYDFVHCPTRVELDLFANPSEKDNVSPFVEMLWERGRLYEKEVLDALHVPCTDLTKYKGGEKEKPTLEAINRSDKLILGGRIQHDDLLGDPDILRFDGKKYVAGDIKSGAGEEGDDDNRKPKKHYAVQLALYTDILERKKLSAGRYAFVWDVNGEEIAYDFTQPMGPKTPQSHWEFYEETLNQVRNIYSKKESYVPAYGSVCKQCYWITRCKKVLSKSNDLTLIPELGRSRRDGLLEYVHSIKDLAEMVKLPSKVRGVGPDMLQKFQNRAKLLSNIKGQPYATRLIEFPQSNIEVFFDVETDPMRDICYLHGFIERKAGDNSSEKYISFFASGPNRDAEKKVFAEAFVYLYAHREHSLYFYSKYERTIWRKLQAKFPDVCTEQQIGEIFESNRSVDLCYDVVKKLTEWPTNGHSIKEIASYLGFSWRDTHPSGAASIEWFDKWVRTGDNTHKQRILEYNEDDCRATRVLLDGIRALKIGPN